MAVAGQEMPKHAGKPLQRGRWKLGIARAGINGRFGRDAVSVRGDGGRTFVWTRWHPIVAPDRYERENRRAKQKFAIFVRPNSTERV